MVSLLAGLRAIEVSGLNVGSVLGSNGILDTINFSKAGTKGNPIFYGTYNVL